MNLGGDGERLRGWLPVPLTPEGVAQAHQAGKGLAGLHPASFTASDLPRAQQTARILEQYIGHQSTPHTGLRDWNTGALAGQKFTDIKDQLFHHIDNPDLAVHQGEPINHYLDRFLALVRPLVASPDLHIVVGHARGASILQGIASKVGGKGQHVDPAFLKVRPEVKPGGIMVIDPDWNVTIHNLPAPSERSKARQGILDHMSKP